MDVSLLVDVDVLVLQSGVKKAWSMKEGVGGDGDSSPTGMSPGEVGLWRRAPRGKDVAGLPEPCSR